MGIFAIALAEQAGDDLNKAFEGMTTAQAAGYGAVLGVAVGTIVLMTVVWYVLQAIADWKIFTKAGEAGWKSLIPIYHYFVEYDLCWTGGYGLIYAVIMVLNASFNTTEGLPTWVVTMVSVLGILAMVLHFLQSLRLAKAFGKGRGFGVLLFLFGPICRLILGFGSAEYVGKP